MNTIFSGILFILWMSILILLKANNNPSSEIVTKVYNGLDYWSTSEEVILVFDHIKQIKGKENTNHYWNNDWKSKRLIEKTLEMVHQYNPTKRNLDFGHVVSPFNGVAKTLKGDSSVVRVSYHMTDALIFLQLAMRIKGVGIKTDIAAEILVVLLRFFSKPALAKIEILPMKRIELYEDLQKQRDHYVDKFLSKHCTEKTAMDILKHYVFEEENSMRQFTMNLKKIGYTKTRTDETRLSDPELYEKLRYNLYLEVPLSRQEAVNRILDIYTLEELNLINVPPENLFDHYVKDNLFDTITFEDYYALNVFLFNDYNTTNKCIYWRIKKAIYRLAIRQLDSIKESNDPKLFSCEKCIDRHILSTLNQNVFFEINNFLFCTEENMKIHQYQCSNDTIKMILNILLSQQYIAMKLNNVFPDLKEYLILPGTMFSILNISNFTISQEIIVSGNHLRVHKSAWITQVANKVSYYTEKDKNNSYVLKPFEPLYCDSEE